MFVCARACLCERLWGTIKGLCWRKHLKAQQFRRLKLPNLELYYVTHNAVQGGWFICQCRGENERKMVDLNVLPRGFFFFGLKKKKEKLSPSEFKSLLSPKGKKQTKNETVLCLDDGKLYCDILLSWLWKPHGCTSLSLCRKSETATGTDSPQSEKRKYGKAGLGIGWDEMKESVKV